MTIKQTLALIRQLGLVASWNPESGQFRVTLPDGRVSAGSEAKAYYTTDRDDAVQTARQMARDTQHVTNEEKARRVLAAMGGKCPTCGHLLKNHLTTERLTVTNVKWTCIANMDCLCREPGTLTYSDWRYRGSMYSYE